MIASRRAGTTRNKLQVITKTIVETPAGIALLTSRGNVAVPLPAGMITVFLSVKRETLIPTCFYWFLVFPYALLYKAFKYTLNEITISSDGSFDGVIEK